MRPFLKIGNLTGLHDARYCAAMGFRLLSFAKDAFTAASLAEIKSWISGPEIAGAFTNETSDEINSYSIQAGLDAIIIQENYPPTEASKIIKPVLFQSLANTNVAALASLFPQAKFEIDSTQIPFALDFLDRCMIRVPFAEAAWKTLEIHGEKILGYSLGNFVFDEEGLIDFDICDTFLHSFTEKMRS